jgi:hypothetical protein
MDLTSPASTGLKRNATSPLLSSPSLVNKRPKLDLPWDQLAKVSKKMVLMIMAMDGEDNPGWRRFLPYFVADFTASTDLALRILPPKQITEILQELNNEQLEKWKHAVTKTSKGEWMDIIGLSTYHFAPGF